MGYKFGNQEFEGQVKNVLREAKCQCSPEYVAKKLKVGFGTARAVLLHLAAKGEIEMFETTTAPFFSIGESQGNGEGNGATHR